MSGRFPKAYQNEVRVDDGLIQYPPFESMDIGARSSGLPKDLNNGPKSLEHVSNRTTGKKG